eukprot:GHVN01037666.1.p1 GENE.GHVN01037666.1~~GHVN01037666.1.p1  ORF type:complete len:311 (+),score=14.41 GHVN01037666.1:13-945(+)
MSLRYLIFVYITELLSCRVYTYGERLGPCSVGGWAPPPPLPAFLSRCLAKKADYSDLLHPKSDITLVINNIPSYSSKAEAVKTVERFLKKEGVDSPSVLNVRTSTVDDEQFDVESHFYQLQQRTLLNRNEKFSYAVFSVPTYKAAIRAMGIRNWDTGRLISVLPEKEALDWSIYAQCTNGNVTASQWRDSLKGVTRHQEQDVRVVAYRKPVVSRGAVKLTFKRASCLKDCQDSVTLKVKNPDGGTTIGRFTQKRLFPMSRDTHFLRLENLEPDTDEDRLSYMLKVLDISGVSRLYTDHWGSGQILHLGKR